MGKGWNESSWFQSREMSADEKAKYAEEKRQSALRPAEPGALVKAYDLLAPVYYSIKAKAGWIPPTLKEVNGYLDVINDKLGVARQAGAVVGINAQLATQMEEASNTIKKIQGPLSQGSSVVDDIAAAMELGRCAKILSNWQGATSSVSNADAAKAFDDAFGALARFLSKLPLVGEYASIFSEISKNNFFSNMQILMNKRFVEADAVNSSS